MKKNRVLTESGAYFPRCVALPAREKLLLEEEMMLYMGQSGGTTNGTPAKTYGTARAAIAGINIQTQEQRQQKQLEEAAVFGIVPTGNTDSSRTSVIRELRNVREAFTDSTATGRATPTNSDSTTEEDTSESCCFVCTIKGWF